MTLQKPKEARDFYRMEPAAWDFGTADLTLEEEAAYLRIVNAIHKHKAPIPSNDRVIAGMFRVSTRKARALLQSLIDAGKVSIQDGMIHNERAISDLIHRGFVSISRAEIGAKGGRNRAENAAKLLKSKDKGQAIGSTREEKRREDIYMGEKFEQFWAVFPKRTNMPAKEKVRSKFDQALAKIDFDALMSAVSAYAASRAAAVAKEGEKAKAFTKSADAWLNGGYWESWLSEKAAPKSDADIEAENRILSEYSHGTTKPIWG